MRHLQIEKKPSIFQERKNRKSQKPTRQCWRCTRSRQWDLISSIELTRRSCRKEKTYVGYPSLVCGVAWNGPNWTKMYTCPPEDPTTVKALGPLPCGSGILLASTTNAWLASFVVTDSWKWIEWISEIKKQQVFYFKFEGRTQNPIIFNHSTWYDRSLQANVGRFDVLILYCHCSTETNSGLIFVSCYTCLSCVLCAKTCSYKTQDLEAQRSKTTFLKTRGRLSM